MPKRSLNWQLVPPLAALVLLAVIVLGWIALRGYENTLTGSLRANLEGRAQYLDSELGPEIPIEPDDFSRRAKRLADATGMRVSMLLADGDVIFDTRNREDGLP